MANVSSSPVEVSAVSAVSMGNVQAVATGVKKAARGFAAMDPAQQRRIASEGGRAAHASGNAHEFTSEEARAAGSKSRGGKGVADVPAVPAAKLPGTEA